MKWISIAAVARNGVIGNGLELPWDIPEDMRFFRDSTRGHPVVMGRKTFDSLKGPLPKRPNAVITRDPHWAYPDVLVFESLEKALKALSQGRASDEVGFVIGGAQIYREAMGKVDEIWLTEIEKDFPGDVFFPEFLEGKFHSDAYALIEKTPQAQEHPQGLKYFFARYGRKPAA